MVQLSHLYMTTGKITALAVWTFVSKVISLLFNTLSVFVITFLPTNKCLLVSWLQSAICIHICPLFYISFPFRSPQSSEYSYLCSTIGFGSLSIIYIVYICQLQSLNPSHIPLSPLGVRKFVLYICISISVLFLIETRAKCQAWLLFAVILDKYLNFSVPQFSPL